MGAFRVKETPIPPDRQFLAGIAPIGLIEGCGRSPTGESRSRIATATTRPGTESRPPGAVDRNARLSSPVEEISRDAGAREGDDAVRTQQLIVASEGRSPAVGVAVRPAHDPVHAFGHRPSRRDFLRVATSEAVQKCPNGVSNSRGPDNSLYAPGASPPLRSAPTGVGPVRAADSCAKMTGAGAAQG